MPQDDSMCILSRAALVAVVAVVAAMASAAPGLISYQGRVTNADGTAIAC